MSFYSGVTDSSHVEHLVQGTLGCPDFSLFVCESADPAFLLHHSLSQVFERLMRLFVPDVLRSDKHAGPPDLASEDILAS